MTVQAAVLEAQSVMEIREIADPEPVGDRPVLVRVGAVGLCGSDVARYLGKAYHYPLVLGHEFSAVVEESPADSQFRPGDRAVVYPLIPDQTDPMSQIGEYALSTGYDYFGSRRDGGLQERLYVPEANLLPIGNDFSLQDAAMVEPAAVALHGVLKFDIPANATALVIGGGPIGFFAAQWLRILGATRVIVADIDQRKLDILAELGFETIDASGDTVAEVQKATAGRGVDCAVESSGLPLTLLQTIESVAPFGQVLLLGDVGKPITLEPTLFSSILRREVTLLGTWNSKITPAENSEWAMVVAKMRSGDLATGPLVSHVVTLDEAPEIFAEVADRTTWYSKVLFAIADEARLERGDPQKEAV